MRVKDIPISTDDGQIIKALEEHTCEIINLCMERLRNYSYLTNCQTGDQVIICKPVNTYLLRSLVICKHKTTIFNYDQHTSWVHKLKRSKCLRNSHTANECKVDWRRYNCGVLGHKHSSCKIESFSDYGHNIMESEKKMKIVWMI